MICRGLLLIALLSGLVLGGAAIFELLHRRVALLVVAGSYFWPLLILQVVGVAAQLLVLGESALRAFGEWRPSPLFSRVGQSVQSHIDNARYEPGTLRFGFSVNAGGTMTGSFGQGKAIRRSWFPWVILSVPVSFRAPITHSRPG